MTRFRVLMIAGGYPDGNDSEVLCVDPAFKMSVGRPPESAGPLCSQPTISRLENLPGQTALIRMIAAMIELFCDSFQILPRRTSCISTPTERHAPRRPPISSGC
jgi:hypothetical protein